MNESEYIRCDGCELSELVRRGEVTPVELAEAAIARIEKCNPRLNAVVEKLYDAGRIAAAEKPNPDVPFAGVPFLMKDLQTFWKGQPMRCGTKLLKDFVPDHDSEMAVRFRKTGVVLLGKTNVPELGLMPVTEPEVYGPTCNPWDTGRTSGGSSGGSAAAVAARMVPIAHGNDGGGSIRVPAACCGVVGFKPTRGRNPIGPDMGQAWMGFATDHVLTRSVRDSAAMLDATAGPDPGAPYVAPQPARPFREEIGAPPGRLRIAFSTQPLLGSRVHADCITGLGETASLLEELGHDIFEAALEVDGEAFSKAFMTMVCAETAASMDEMQDWAGKKDLSGFESTTRVLGLLGERASAASLSKALRFMLSTGRVLGRFFENCDVLLTPTVAELPLKIGALTPQGAQAAIIRILAALRSKTLASSLAGIDAIAKQAFDFIPWTPLFNASGQPAVSLPLSWNSQGLPIGMHFAAKLGREDILFRLAAQLEEARPWRERMPFF